MSSKTGLKLKQVTIAVALAFSLISVAGHAETIVNCGANLKTGDGITNYEWSFGTTFKTPSGTRTAESKWELQERGQTVAAPVAIETETDSRGQRIGYTIRSSRIQANGNMVYRELRLININDNACVGAELARASAVLLESVNGSTLAKVKDYNCTCEEF